MDKKGMIKTGVIGLIFLLLIVSIVTITLSEKSQAAKLGTEYILGESIKLDLKNIANYTVKITNSKGSYYYKDSLNDFVFKPDVPGEYAIQLNYLGKQEVYNFKVSSKNSTSNKSTSTVSSILTSTSNNNTNYVTNTKKYAGKIQNINKNKIIINENVKYTINEKIENNKVKLKIPAESTNITVLKDKKDVVYEITEDNSLISSIASIFSQAKKSKYLLVKNVSGNIELSYYTPAPKATEFQISKNKKEVKISAPDSLNYTNVLAYTELDNQIKIQDKNRIKLYWVEEKKYMPFDSFDLDSDGFLDSIEWTVPHLSNQTFEIIVITKAEHLDISRQPISYIYDSVKELDGIWSETINAGEYVRVTFERNLSNFNDITIYPRFVSGNPIVKVYIANTSTEVAQFTNIRENEYNKVFLIGLNNSQDSFDLQITGGAIQFDHILDPAVLGICQNIITCLSGGAAVTCTCTEINTENSVYSNNAASFLTSKSNTGPAMEIINFTNSSFIPSGATINSASIGINYSITSGANTCVISYSTNGMTSWTTLNSSCTTHTAQTLETYSLSSLNRTQLNNFTLNISMSRTSTPASTTITLKIDLVNFTVDYTAAVANGSVSVVLNTPANLQNSSSKSITFNYTPITSTVFKNCSLWDNESGSFSFVSLNTSSITNGSANFFSKTYSSDGLFLWNIMCSDNSNNFAFASSNYTVRIDSTGPAVSLVSPLNNSVLTDPYGFNFTYNATDFSSIDNCSIYFDNALSQSSTSITKNVNQSFYQFLPDGLHNWTVWCTDYFGNIGKSQNGTLNVSINQAAFQARFYETFTQDFSSTTALINLDNTRDATQNTAAFSIASGALANILNATTAFINNNGALIPRGSTITFSSSFTVTSANVAITWKLYVVNATGNTLLCQNGNDNSGGTPVSSGTISSANTTCINRDIRLSSSDRLMMIMDGYNSHPSQVRSVTAAWDSSTSSFIDMNVTTEGFLVTNISSPLVDPNIALNSFFNATCAVYCSVGICRNTQVYLQYNSSSFNWLNMNSTSGNLILASGETNPHSLGNVSSIVSTNFSVKGNVQSVNNLRCIAISTYDSANGTNYTQVTVTSATPAAPFVSLSSPSNGTWFNYTNITLSYNATDINANIANSSLILNDQINISNQSTITNGAISNFTINLTNGFYNWTVNVTDSTSLTGTNSTRRSFYVDTEKPAITLSSPSNASSFFVDFIEFNYSTTDNLALSTVCNLTIDSVIRRGSISSSNNTNINSTITGLTIGTHYWNVSCMDLAGNVNISQTRVFTIQDLPPSVSLLTTNNTFFNNASVVLTYNASDNNGISTAYLIINGLINITNQSTVTNNAISNFTLNLPNGIYNWSVNVTDISGLNASNITRVFTVDTQKPIINLSFPANASTSLNGTLPFNFTITDNLNLAIYCNLSVGTFTDLNFSVTNGSLTNRVVTNLSDGIKFWNVSCIDLAGNTNTSETRTLNISEAPLVRLITANNSFFNITSFNLSYYPTDNTNLSICSLYIDGALNQSNSTTIVNGQRTNFTVNNLTEGRHYWYTVCADYVNLTKQSESRNFTVDFGSLNVTLLSPSSGSTVFSSTVSFIYNVTDNLSPFLICNITVNSLLLDNYSLAQNGANTTRNITFSQGGFKLWNVTCVDDSGNVKVSPTINFTLASTPVVSLSSPSNGTWFNYTNITFSYNATDDNLNIANSSLILNDQINISNQSTITNGAISNFTINLTNGFYNWTVNVTDSTSLTGTNSTRRSFYVDTQKPSIIVNSPAQSEILSWNNVTLNFTILDNLSPTFVCNVSVDDFNELENINTTNGTNIKYLTKADGNYSFNIYCIDIAGNFNTSSTINFTVEAPPNVTLMAPINNFINNSNSLQFVYLPSDPIGLNNCTLILDGINNDTTFTPTNNQNNSLIKSLAEGTHNWTVECTDSFPDLNVFRAQTRNFSIDLTSPTVFMFYPNSTNTLKSSKFNFTASDTVDTNLSCNLYLDNALNVSNISVFNSTNISQQLNGISLGSHTWNVSCIDDAGNRKTSNSATFNVTLADLSISSSNITFNNTSPTENETILINATVNNLINVSMSNVSVAIYYGNPDSGGTQIGQTQIIQDISALGTGSVSVSWNTILGTSSIYAVVDPPFSTNGSIQEYNETNNKASNNLTVGGWEFVHGDISSLTEFELDDSTNKTLLRWASANFNSGNVFVTDSESNIIWNSLKAIGKNKTGSFVNNDFSELDTLLNMSTFNDSVSGLYANSSGGAKLSRTYSVFNSFITQVPYANSTNNTSFFTGILWDSADDTNGQFDTVNKEDIVFVAEINKSKQGAYGTYDYEMRIPAKLREYKTTDIKKVIFYTEIN